MSFQDFTLASVQAELGLNIADQADMFLSVPPVALTPALATMLLAYAPLAIGNISEKARSEWLVAPLLGEVWLRSNHEISVISGASLNVDEAAGLKGICDFILSRGRQLFAASAPIVTIVEAKRDSISDGLGQCAAEMVAAQRFNLRAGRPIDPIYGCVTTGTFWRFLRLRGTELDIDLTEYPISQPDRILGVLLHCCGVTLSA
ncbi:hypothetical protein [Zavarzinella formosa]|uniref:hypothetical protein n=1 Tax=Zavarzinella formosa TaxID=360055 RepID=UPI0002D89FB6|nr:hypothetical protein [Zavarzinella formosa]